MRVTTILTLRPRSPTRMLLRRMAAIPAWKTAFSNLRSENRLPNSLLQFQQQLLQGLSHLPSRLTPLSHLSRSGDQWKPPEQLRPCHRLRMSTTPLITPS